MEKSRKKPQRIFHCETCHYSTSRSTDYSKHLSTHKHQMLTNTYNLSQNVVKNRKYYCECGSFYQHRQSLFSHKKKCTVQAFEPQPTMALPSKDEIDYKQLLLQAMDQLKKKDEIMEQMIHKVGHTTNNTTNNNTQNNHFNINVFLNEECKDAINFSDFIDRIEVSHDDLENNAQLGFVEGISKILMDNLNQLSISERPIHCTDVKRETMYIKDDNEWKKEKEENTRRINDAIQEVSRKSMISLMDWKRTNPDYKDGDSEFSTKCIAMQQQSMAIGQKDTLFPKVARRVARCSTIDKSDV
jgi:hypothetical protein